MRSAEYKRIYRREWRRKNPEKAAAIIQNRMKRCKSLTLPERREVFRKFKGKCFHCGIKTIWDGDDFGMNPKWFTVDHLIPIVHGGTNDRKNLVASCRRCNYRKNGKINWIVKK
jgi:5-methylcytosine-specific restriction endonuclease McrA